MEVRETEHKTMEEEQEDKDVEGEEERRQVKAETLAFFTPLSPLAIIHLNLHLTWQPIQSSPHHTLHLSFKPYRGLHILHLIPHLCTSSLTILHIYPSPYPHLTHSI